MEDAEIQPEEIIEERPEVSILDKIKSYKFKILGGIFGVLVFTGATFGAYRFGQRQAQPTPTPTPAAVVTPTPDATANWKTYTNTEYGYSIKYPTDWVVLEGTTDGEDYARFFKGPYSEGEPTPQTYISILIRKNPRKLSLDEWLEEDKNRPFAEEPTILTIDEVRALKWVNKGEIGKDSTIIFLEKNKVVHQIASLLMAGNIEEIKHTFNLILSTFRFLEEEEEWETYKDDAFRYSFKYPPGFLITDYSVADKRQIKFTKENYEVMVRVDREEETPYFLDQEPTGETQLGGLTARLYKFPDGFCEIGTCTPPFVAVVAFKGDYKYVMEFYQTTEISGIYQQILSTFRFLD